MSDTLPGLAPVPDHAEQRQRLCGDRGCTEPAYRCDGCGAEGCGYALRKACRCEGGPDESPLYDDAPEAGSPRPLFLSADGYTVLARDEKGEFHPVGDVTERTHDGFVWRARGTIESVSGDVTLSSPPACACGSLIPCAAHETAEDRREAMRKIREKMTADMRSLGADKVIACDSFRAPGDNPGARVLPKFDPPETVKRVVDGAIGTRSGR